jgi:hypothetical protein
VKPALSRATDALEGAASAEDVAGRIAAVLAEGGRADAVGQFELYLEAARRPGLREAASDCVAAYEAFARAALELLGSPHAYELASIFVAYSDGLGLHRLARGEDAEPDELAERLMALYARTHDTAAVAT